MPQKVQRTKRSMNLSVAITSTILALIPVIILLFTGTSSFKQPYGIYVLTVLGIVVYFSFVIGMFSWKNKILYTVLDAINIVLAVGFIIYSYINSTYQGGLLLHMAASFFLVLSFYQMSDADQGDSYYVRYLVPILLDIAGLIFILWFINVHMKVVVHIVLATIFNLFNLAIFFLPSLVKLISNRNEFFSGLSSKSVEYEEETEDEIKERKELKEIQKALKEEHKQKEMQQQQEQLHANDNHNAGNHTKWIPNPATIDHLLWSLDFEFNKIIDYINRDIERNNFTLRGLRSESTEDLKTAAKSNKQIKSGCKYLRKQTKKMKNNLISLSQRVFTREDCYKEFTFNPLSGKMKVKASKSEKPVLEVLSYKIYFTNITEFSKDKHTLNFEGEADLYLKPLD